MLEELRSLQADEKMNAQRTPQLLEDVEKEVEGLDAGLRTAWQQVQQKWKILFSTLEELVDMQEQKKLNLGRAPQLLNIVDQRCSKGLSTRYTKAVSNVQLRWMAITQRGGILTELRLMEKNGLHWRRTHELLLLIDEQYEGFADVDARSLEVVQRRWLKVQDLLEDVVRRKLEIGKVLKPIYTNMSYSKAANDAGNRPLSPRQQASNSVESFAFETGVDGIGQLEGMLEWYAIKEAKCELERKPYHRITTEAEKKSYSDARLLITQAEMVFSPMNVRIALEDRGVIPKTPNNDSTDGFSRTTGTTLDAWVSPSSFDPKTGSQELVLPKKLLDEIKELEGLFEKHGDNDQQTYEVANPERVVELYLMIESLGKIDLLRKVDHVLRRNCELTVPDSYHSMLREMTIRQIPTAEVENLVKSLVFVLQKEALVEKGINVSSTANTAVLLQLMNQYRVKEVTLPQDMSSIQTLLQDRKKDHKGEPVLLRGIRIGTQATGVANRPTDMSSETFGALNTGLGIIDTHVEMLRKSLLFEALHKRNSLASTFPVETHILDHEVDEAGVDAFAAAVVNAEVDLSVDYLALVERFQQLLVHEVYTKRLAEYAAQDRCMRALLRVPRDQVVTKEDIAIGLRKLNEKTIGTNYRLPVEAFTREELLAAARAGHIRDPDKEILERCPHGKNTRAMAYYAAVSYAANAYQEATSFRSRVDPDTMHLLDTFPYKQRSSQKNYSTPKDQSPKTFWYTPAKDFEASSADKPELIEVLQKRLHLASAAFTLRNRWLQRGHGWCDNAFGEGVGVKVLLQRLLLFEAVDKIHMVETEALLKEVRDKCEKLCPHEQDAQANLEERYQSNLELLEDLVTHAERCLNKRKMHSENTPVLLHKLEQVCVVPSGLNDRHREAYHVVTSHWSLHRQHLTELEEMQMEGIFNITRIPELLGQMKYHTEGKAGSEELSRDKLVASAQKVDSELQTNVVSRKLDEVRRGQRKEPLNLHLEINAGEVATDETKWKELSPIKRAAAPLSPHDKQTSWNLVRNTNLAAGPIGNEIKMKIESKSHAHSERKQSLGDELKQLLRLPPKLFMKSQEEKITPEYYFPQEVVLEATRSMLPGQTK
ncbi:hypothetical protein BBJ29_008304 [Phytophthora kernoviae]|uniref:Uncharacterized protein n=1 Tax=Phytophthora kernoviae TaxID=325452 RepID=A0A3F2S3F6_9STRA|nr:hypothetical protein BBP00_00000321 [Phytophthora kernoviae]RLN70743.1 hypothetical protein BBJ29_008304 [Phytophthora kernoviae]